uniref:DUF4939 domain-containing protein n=1 Tax=Terrapene triunguis TaxID=2587831 RepID=A0A674I0V4_9SAUR
MLPGGDPHTASPSVAAHNREPRSPVPLPEHFNGDRQTFRGVINQCRLLLLLHTRSYPTDQVKVGLVIRLLKGDALDWTSPRLEQASPMLSDSGNDHTPGW